MLQFSLSILCLCSFWCSIYVNFLHLCIAMFCSLLLLDYTFWQWSQTAIAQPLMMMQPLLLNCHRNSFHVRTVYAEYLRTLVNKDYSDNAVYELDYCCVTSVQEFMDFTSKILVERTNVAQRAAVREAGNDLYECVCTWSIYLTNCASYTSAAVYINLSLSCTTSL